MAAAATSGGFRRAAWRLTRFAAIAYLAVLLMFLFLENRLIFVPSREPRNTWRPPLPTIEEVAFRADDGTKLTGWFFPHPEPRAVVLFCNGNAGNLSYWADVHGLLNTQLQVAVLGFDYRGYGRSEGSPSEKGVLADARAARTWLCERTKSSPEQIVLMGRSIGGAVAIDLSQDGCRALVVESTFTTLPEVACRLFRWLPVRTCMKSRFASIDKIAKHRGPLLVSHGDADELVPFEMGRALFDAAPGDGKQFYVIEGGNHNDPQPDEYYRRLDRFFEELP